MFRNLVSNIMKFLARKNYYDNEYVVEKRNKSIILRIGENVCLGLRFVVVYDPLSILSSIHMDKIEKYMYNFSTFLSMLHDDVVVVYSKVSESYDNIIKKIESRINKLRVMLELGDSDVKKARELKILEKIHENLLDSKNVYRIILLFVIKVESRCSDVENVLNERTKNLLNLIHTYLDLKPQIIEPGNLLSNINVITLPNTRILMSKRKSILIVGDRGAALLPIDRTYTATINNVDLSGLYIGYEITTNVPVILSPETHLKFHGVIIGPTGKGKTTLLASMFVRASVKNYKVIAIDFKGDLSRYLGDSASILYGVNIEFLINQFEKSNRGLNKLTFDISRIWANVLGLRKSEAYILFKLLQQTIVEKENLSILSNYIIKDKRLKMSFNSDTYNRIIESIEMLCSSNYAPDPGVDIINNSYVLNLERYPNYMKELLSLIILSFEKNSSRPLNTFNKLILVDEAWRLKNSKPNILSALYREGRSLGIGVFSSSQLLRDLPAALLENSHTFILFGSKSKDYINDIRSSFNLTEREIEKLSNLKVGEAAMILKDSKRPVWVRIVPEVDFVKK